MSYNIETICGHTWRITETVKNGTPVYIYLLEGSQKALLIDTGYGSFDLKAAIEQITDLPVTVILTHGHADHIGGSAQFDEVLLHRDDMECYRWHWETEVREFLSLDENDPYPKDRPELIDETWTTDLGDRKISLIHAPGHTPGSVCVLDEKNRMLFTGDACVKGNVLLCLKYSLSVNHYASGIRNILAKEDEYDLMWPGHHETPLNKNILKQLEEAAHRIIKGDAKGEQLELAGIMTNVLTYKDIGIVYPEEGQTPII